VSYNGDMNIDNNGRAHFFHVIVDSPWTNVDPRSIIEIYETGPNVWAYKWIAQNLNEGTGLGYPGVTGNPPTPYLNQTNNAVHGAISADGQILGLVWLDAATTAPADTMPDIWFSWRHVNGTTWSSPSNLTQTPTFPELLLHAAPIMKSNGANSYTMFVGRSYQQGINTYPPDNGVVTTFFAAPHTFTVTDVPENGQPGSFRLQQNYPNPFNPSTTIRYSLGRASSVTITVYNTLGQEVATVVDELRAAGNHEATFDASRLSSGVYIYKLTAGDFTESRKMMLVR
jgi:hypothetical protein